MKKILALALVAAVMHVWTNAYEAAAQAVVSDSPQKYTITKVIPSGGTYLITTAPVSDPSIEAVK